MNSSKPRSANCPSWSTICAAVPPSVRLAGEPVPSSAIMALTEVHIVAGSRPAFSQASRRPSRRAVSSGACQVFHSLAWRAVMRNIRGPLVPTSSGSGDWTGLGSQGASVKS